MKKLIVAAVAAAVALPVAATADATMYGKIHATVGSYDNDNGVNDGDLHIADNSSRVGIKGSEDLGGGLKAVYDFQFGMDVDDNTESSGTALSGRHSYVGMGGGFGTVLLGRLSSPRKMVAIKTNLFTDRMGDLRTLSNSADEGYLANVLAYASPSMGGVSVTAAYTTDHGVASVGGSGTNDNNDEAAFSANAIYSNGGVMVGLGYTDLMDSVADGVDATDITIGASVKMGSAKVTSSYTMTERGSWDGAHYNIGAAFTMGSNTFLAQYNGTDNDGDNMDSTQITVGVDHKMSKRTSVYAQYSTLDNDSSAANFVTERAGGVATGGAGADSDGFAVGLIHKF